MDSVFRVKNKSGLEAAKKWIDDNVSDSADQLSLHFSLITGKYNPDAEPDYHTSPLTVAKDTLVGTANKFGYIIAYPGLLFYKGVKENDPRYLAASGVAILANALIVFGLTSQVAPVFLQVGARNALIAGGTSLVTASIKEEDIGISTQLSAATALAFGNRLDRAHKLVKVVQAGLVDIATRWIKNNKVKTDAVMATSAIAATEYMIKETFSTLTDNSGVIGKMISTLLKVGYANLEAEVKKLNKKNK